MRESQCNSSTGKVDAPGRHIGIAQGVANVGKLHPSTVTEIPLRVCEAIHLRDGIHTGMACAEDALLEGKAIRREREFYRNAHGKRDVALGSEFDGLPFQIAHIQWAFWRAGRIEREAQVSAVDSDGGFDIVVENPAIREQ